MAHRNFRVACCEYFACPEEGYAKAVFWHCLHRRAYLPARLFGRLFPDFFAPDFQLIEAVATTGDLTELEDELNKLLRTTPPFGILRRNLQIRVSARRILDLACAVFPNASLTPDESKDTEFFMRPIDGKAGFSASGK